MTILNFVRPSDWPQLDRIGGATYLREQHPFLYARFVFRKAADLADSLRLPSGRLRRTLTYLGDLFQTVEDIHPTGPPANDARIHLAAMRIRTDRDLGISFGLDLIGALYNPHVLARTVEGITLEVLKFRDTGEGVEAQNPTIVNAFPARVG